VAVLGGDAGCDMRLRFRPPPLLLLGMLSLFSLLCGGEGAALAVVAGLGVRCCCSCFRRLRMLRRCARCCCCSKSPPWRMATRAAITVLCRGSLRTRGGSPCFELRSGRLQAHCYYPTSSRAYVRARLRWANGRAEGGARSSCGFTWGHSCGPALAFYTGKPPFSRARALSFQR